jgi:hypothetical protein
MSCCLRSQKRQSRQIECATQLQDVFRRRTTPVQENDGTRSRPERRSLLK